MPVTKIYKNLAFAIVLLCMLCAVVGLIRIFTSGFPLDMLASNLDDWASEIGFHLMLIILAASGVNYLASKK